MASPFWTYFSDKLRWPLIDAPGPIQAVIKGLAHRLDIVRDDAVFLREQWLPQLCETDLVAEHGFSRGLVRFKETPEQFRQRVVNAYKWHLMGGKQEGLPEILRFYGFDIAELESLRKYQSSRWAEFQVGLHNPQSLEEQNAMLTDLETLVWLINEYKPARSVLARLYTDIYNITPLIWSEGQYSEHYYSHFSGIPTSDLGDGWNDKGLILSFGLRFLTQAERIDYGSPTFSGFQRQGFIAPYIDAPVWSQFNYSDGFPQKHGFTIGELFSLDWCEQTTTSDSWAGSWDNRHWAKKSEWDRILPKWRMSCTSISRSQLVYSDTQTTPDAGLWGGLNACYSVPTAVVIDNPNVWGSFAYSDSQERQEITIHEQSLNQYGVVAEPANLTDGAIGTAGVICMEATRRSNRFWSGTWDNRCWQSDSAFISIKSYPKEPE